MVLIFFFNVVSRIYAFCHLIFVLIRGIIIGLVVHFINVFYGSLTQYFLVMLFRSLLTPGSCLVILMLATCVASAPLALFVSFCSRSDLCVYHFALYHVYL